MGKENYPGREAFLRSPRARTLRDLSLEIARVASTVLSGPASTSPADRERAYGRLEHLQGLLLGQGIRLNMHARPGGFCADQGRDPVVVAEYVAGQIMQVCEGRLQTSAEAMLLSQEFGERIPMPIPALRGDERARGAFVIPPQEHGEAFPFCPHVFMCSLLHVIRFLDPDPSEGIEEQPDADPGV